MSIPSNTERPPALQEETRLVTARARTIRVHAGLHHHSLVLLLRSLGIGPRSPDRGRQAADES